MIKFRNTIIPIFFLLGSYSILNGQGTINEITFLESEEFINSYSLEVFAIILDTRPSGMYKKSRIDKAVNIENTEALEAMADSLDTETPLYMYCSTQTRSTSVANFLKDKGFSRLYVLEGGMMEWRRRDMPMDKKRLRKRERK